ncbi:MAG: hypothetical protein R6X02_05240 [Enhygromyxa sp.]
MAAPPILAGPSTEVEIVEARLEIDTSQVGAGAEVLHRRIDERANVVLRQAKVLPGDQDDAALLIIVRELDGDEPGFAVTFELRAADGSPIAEPLALDCPLCTETELVARVEAELATVIPSLRPLDEPPPPAPTSSMLPSPQPQARPDAGQPRPHVGMLAGGVTLLVLGSGMLGSGVGLAIPEPRIDEDYPLDLITTRPVGYALLAGGTVTAAAGAILTAIAVERRRQIRWSAAPFGDRSRAGVVLAWRFR